MSNLLQTVIPAAVTPVTPPAWARVWPADDEKRPVSKGQQR
jgi:hypothetical protein